MAIKTKIFKQPWKYYKNNEQRTIIHIKFFYLGWKSLINYDNFLCKNICQSFFFCTWRSIIQHVMVIIICCWKCSCIWFHFNLLTRNPGQRSLLHFDMMCIHTKTILQAKLYKWMISQKESKIYSECSYHSESELYIVHFTAWIASL